MAAQEGESGAAPGDGIGPTPGGRAGPPPARPPGPALSVVLVTPDSFATIRTTVSHLRAQTARDRLEIVIVAPGVDPLALDPTDLSDFYDYQVVEVGPITSVAAAKATAIRRARAPVVAFAEDHCFPEPGWAAALIEMHADGWVGVGPVVGNANPSGALSWTAFMMHFGRWAEPHPAREVEQVPWHNGSYKRDALLELGDELRTLLVVEGYLQDALRARGYRMYVTPSARVAHVNISVLGSWVRHGFYGGRLYGAFRARREAWSRARRLLYVAGGPLVPVVRLRRLLQEIRRCGRQDELLPRALPALALGLVVHMVGEVTGYVAGAGDAEEQYSRYEMGRYRHLTAQDRRAMGA
jgi:GT2 family glycosyltransferase